MRRVAARPGRGGAGGGGPSSSSPSPSPSPARCRLRFPVARPAALDEGGAGPGGRAWGSHPPLLAPAAAPIPAPPPTPSPSRRVWPRSAVTSPADRAARACAALEHVLGVHDDGG
jgi:hypothetical protein